jgi:hypothetical protein
MKNYLKYSLGLIVFVMIALIAMHWLPAITIDGYHAAGGLVKRCTSV